MPTCSDLCSQERNETPALQPLLLRLLSAGARVMARAPPKLMSRALRTAESAVAGAEPQDV